MWWCKSPKAWWSNHRPPLLVIVQTFEVEPFSVCETRHLQRKWKQCASVTNNCYFQVTVCFYQNNYDVDFYSRNKDSKCKSDSPDLDLLWNIFSLLPVKRQIEIGWLRYKARILTCTALITKQLGCFIKRKFSLEDATFVIS